LDALTARLDSLETGQCPARQPVVAPARTGEARTDSLIATLEALSQRLETLRATRCQPGAAPTAVPSPGAPSPGAPSPSRPDARAPADTTDELAALRAAAAQAAGAPAPPAPPPAAGGAEPAPRDTTPKETEFVGKQRNASALNPEISATGDIRLVARDGRQHDNGVAREFEVALQSALDPFSSTKIFLTFEDGEVGVEEGYIYWTGLPGRLRVDVGKVRQQIGDLNRWHLHALPETEYPLVYQRFLGPEGLSGVGLSLYTALPVSVLGGTHEVWLQGTTAESDPLYAGGRQPTLLFRLQNFWQLDRSSYAQLGFTGTGGNNDDADLRSRLLGLDFRLTYRPPEAATRREITLRAEGYRLHADELAATTNRYGAFVDLNAKLSRRWVLGGRYDWVEAPRGPDDTEWRLTPSVTWWQSEFVFLRLEGEHRHRDLDGSHNLLSLQAVWAMGPHKHETY
ncbi:MAG TPA: hypothetical protein VHR43_11195, partial [Gemmatimonadales bacterium]|nr:hypothetical protein [Gemmatimonadales bacterium]